MSGRKFYDIHFHAMNMAHPNILAFIRRIDWQMLLLASPLAPLAAVFGQGKLKNVRNLLSVMENDIGSFFLVVEYYLKNGGLVKDGVLTIGGYSYDSIVLTPLLMDFGYKNILSDTLYRIPPQKPIKEQVEDVFNGIADYFTSELTEAKSARGEIEYRVIPRQSRAVFEIYPFLGINTKNYDTPRIEKMLTKYFGTYRGRYTDFINNLGAFGGDIGKMGSNFFAGIKLYPPIGFDPWPEDGEERDKVEALYRFCCANGVPVTTHCSDGGFVLDRDAAEFTDPRRWERVLSNPAYSDLKLNFAHFGVQNKRKLLVMPRYEWRDRIVTLMRTYPNVYADFSYIAQDDGYYQSLKVLCNQNRFLADRILFGSDFMINLLDVESYNSYLELFDRTDHFDDYQKDAFCRGNAERFLWRER